MDRRRFLGLSGAAAVGTLAGADLVGARGPSPAADEETPDEEIPSPSSGLQRVVWSVDTARPVAAMTFDDGPDPEFTPRILDILDRHGVTATFMVMAHNAIQHPHLVRQIVAAGHEIGGHGWNHLNLAEVTVAETRIEIDSGTKVIEDLAGVPIRVFRPPYGRFSEASVQLLAQSQRDLIVWSVTRGDLTWQDPARIASHVIDSLGPGDIVDLHDGIGRGTFNRGTKVADRLRGRREVEVEALPRILEGVRANGVHLETVSDLLSR